MAFILPGGGGTGWACAGFGAPDVLLAQGRLRRYRDILRAIDGLVSFAWAPLALPERLAASSLITTPLPSSVPVWVPSRADRYREGWRLGAATFALYISIVTERARPSRESARGTRAESQSRVSSQSREDQGPLLGFSAVVGEGSVHCDRNATTTLSESTRVFKKQG